MVVYDCGCCAQLQTVHTTFAYRISHCYEIVCVCELCDDVTTHVASYAFRINQFQLKPSCLIH